jgi:PAS domain S-box-containing protein
VTISPEAWAKKLEALDAAEATLRRQGEELAIGRRALEGERSRYHELFDSAPIGYVLTNCEGVIQKVNQAATALLGERGKLLEGLPLAGLVAREDRAALSEIIGRLQRAEREQIENWEARIEPPRAAAFPASLAVNLVLDDLGRPAGLRWVLRDVTERREAQERVLRLNADLEQRVSERTAALEAANREMEAFSYSVSHDLRAPLRCINGFTKALLDEYGDKLGPQGLRYVQYTHEAALRMGGLIEDLMGLSRAARGELRRQEVDLGALAAQVLAELQRREPQRKVETTVTPELKACGDPGLLRIALENLLSNSWKFTAKRDQGEIEVGATQQNSTCFFWVRDNGAGFNMTQADRLFGVFQRLHSQQEFPGTGIGLATVRRIITRHGGEVWAEGRPGEGATFYFTLPDQG